MATKKRQAEANPSSPNNLSELINSYNQADRTSLASQFDSGQPKLANVDRKTLLERGLPIDPDLIKQVAGDFKVLPNPANSSSSTKTILHTSSGETINTKLEVSKLVAASGDDQLIDESCPEKAISGQQVARNQREISKVVRRARQKYGNRHYNRLDPVNYTDEKIALDKRQRRSNRLVTIVAVSLIAVVIFGVAGLLLYRQLKPLPPYQYTVCSEQELAKAIQNYRTGNTDGIVDYVDHQIIKANYVDDAKCLYINALEFKSKKITQGLDDYRELYNQSVDKSSVDRLLRQQDAPSLDELLSTKK